MLSACSRIGGPIGYSGRLEHLAWKSVVDPDKGNNPASLRGVFSFHVANLARPRGAALTRYGASLAYLDWTVSKWLAGIKRKSPWWQANIGRRGTRWPARFLYDGLTVLYSQVLRLVGWRNCEQGRIRDRRFFPANISIAGRLLVIRAYSSCFSVPRRFRRAQTFMYSVVLVLASICFFGEDAYT